MGFNVNVPTKFGQPTTSTGQSLMPPKQAIQLALAMKKKSALDSGDYQAPNLMQALKKKKKGASNGSNG